MQRLFIYTNTDRDWERAKNLGREKGRDWGVYYVGVYISKLVYKHILTECYETSRSAEPLIC